MHESKVRFLKSRVQCTLVGPTRFNLHLFVVPSEDAVASDPRFRWRYPAYRYWVAFPHTVILMHLRLRRQFRQRGLNPRSRSSKNLKNEPVSSLCPKTYWQLLSFLSGSISAPFFAFFHPWTVSESRNVVLLERSAWTRQWMKSHWNAIGVVTVMIMIIITIT